VRPTLEGHEYRARGAAFESHDDFEETEISVDMSNASECRSRIEEALVGLVWWSLDPNGVAIVFSDEGRIRRR
jgi:hypothetical protein